MYLLAGILPLPPKTLKLLRVVWKNERERLQYEALQEESREAFRVSNVAIIYVRIVHAHGQLVMGV